LEGGQPQRKGERFPVRTGKKGNRKGDETQIPILKGICITSREKGDSRKDNSASLPSKGIGWREKKKSQQGEMSSTGFAQLEAFGNERRKPTFLTRKGGTREREKKGNENITLN